MVLKKHELLEVIKKELYTPVVGDILDQMGLYHQFLPQAVRPLRDDMKLAGYAMTVLMIDVFGQQKKPFGYLTEALYFPGDVMPRILLCAPRWWITAAGLK